MPHAVTTPNNNQYMLPTPKPANPSHLRLDNLVINGPSSPPQIHHSSYQPTNPHQQYNGYLTSQSSNSTAIASSYHSATSPLSPNTTQKVESVNYYQHQESKPPFANLASPIQQSGAQRLDSLLLMSSSQQTNSLNERNSNLSVPPQPPERGSSFTVMSQTQGVLRNSTSTNMSSAGSERSNMAHNRGSETNPTTKRVSFHDPNANQPPPQPPMEQIREDPDVCKIYIVVVEVTASSTYLLFCSFMKLALNMNFKTLHTVLCISIAYIYFQPHLHTC
jgi:hypothetical protein